MLTVYTVSVHGPFGYHLAGQPKARDSILREKEALIWGVGVGV